MTDESDTGERIEASIEALEDAQQAARRALDKDQFGNTDENPLVGINHALAHLKIIESEWWDEDNGPSALARKIREANEDTALAEQFVRRGDDHEREHQDTDGPTTELVRLEADSRETHALLCAVLRAKRREERRENPRYPDELDEWFDVIQSAYYADRRDGDKSRRYADRVTEDRDR